MLKDLNCCLTSVVWYMWNIQKSFLWQFSWFRLKWWKQLIKRADSVSYKWDPRSRLLGAAPHITQLFSEWSQWNLDLRSTTSSRSLFHSEIVFPCECVCTQINLSVWAFMVFSLTQGFIIRFYSVQFFRQNYNHILNLPAHFNCIPNTAFSFGQKVSVFSTI